MRFPITQRLTDWFKKLSNSRKILLIAFMALLIFGSPWLYQRATRLYNKKICIMGGGEWTLGGMAENQYCVSSFEDGGKACHSSEECLGGCVLYEVIVGQPTPSVGVCRINNDPFVCYADIEYPHLYGCAD